MKTCVLVASMAAFVAQQNPGGSRTQSIQGVWQAVEVTITTPPGRTVKPQPNLAIFTAKHYSRTSVSAEQPRPIVADPAKATADELRAAWGAFVGEAGTYEISENRITLHPAVAKNQAAVGSPIMYSFKLDGDTLLLTLVSDRNGPARFPETVKAVRVE